MSDIEERVRSVLRRTARGIPPVDGTLYGMAAQERLERRSKRTKRLLAAGFAAITVAAVVVVVTVLTGSEHADHTGNGLQASSTSPSCLGSVPRNLKHLQGSVGGAANGERFTRLISLDNGTLTIKPVSPSTKASVGKQHGLCTLMASIDSNGLQTYQDVLDNGVEFGLAHIYLRPTGPRPSDAPTVVGPPPLPKVSAAFDSAVAWVAVIRAAEVSSGDCETPPAAGSGSATSPGTRLGDSGIEVVAVLADDATMGVLYVPGGNSGCEDSQASGPISSVLLEGVSVPWALKSRSSDGSAAALEVYARSCDRLGQGTVSRGRTSVIAVLVERPLGDCGRASPTVVPVAPATLNGRLSVKPRHAPVGALDADAGVPR